MKFALLLIVLSLPALAGMALKRNLWRSGSTIVIGVKNSTPADILCLEKQMGHFTQIIPLNFSFFDKDAYPRRRSQVELELRREDLPNGSYGNSHIGNSSFRTEKMVISLPQPSSPNRLDNYLCESFRYRILHEFGHLLGLKHEHQHPEAPPVLLEKMRSQFQSGFNAALIPIDPRSRIGRSLRYSSYDVLSIMHYNFNWDEEMLPHFTVDLRQHSPFGRMLRQADELSEGDIQILQTLYPR